MDESKTEEDESEHQAAIPGGFRVHQTVFVWDETEDGSAERQMYQATVNGPGVSLNLETVHDHVQLMFDNSLESLYNYKLDNIFETREKAQAHRNIEMQSHVQRQSRSRTTITDDGESSHEQSSDCTPSQTARLRTKSGRRNGSSTTTTNNWPIGNDRVGWILRLPADFYGDEFAQQEARKPGAVVEWEVTLDAYVEEYLPKRKLSKWGSGKAPRYTFTDADEKRQEIDVLLLKEYEDRGLLQRAKPHLLSPTLRIHTTHTLSHTHTHKHGKTHLSKCL